VYASAIAVTGADPATVYAQFRAAVAQAQLTQWLAGLDSASTRSTIIDISGKETNASELATRRGHHVVRVLPAGEEPMPPPGAATVLGDEFGLEFVADGCADGVIAEDGTLSRNLAAESMVSEIARVLRPGGRVFACVDNQTRGMAALAQQNAWPNLADLPRADVLLVPWPDGTITRCYASEQLRELFTAAGFDVSWIRPRTVFAQRAVSYLLARDPGSFPQLLSAELRARSDDSVGDQLVVSARRR